MYQTLERHRGSQHQDINGREYLRLEQATDGMLVELDDGFNCRSKGRAMLYVHHENRHRLFFFCDDGCHFIDGQADNGVHCVGIYPLKD